MYCEHCGGTVADGSKFCGSCGAKTEPAQPAYEPQAEQQTSSAQSYYAPPSYAQTSYAPAPQAAPVSYDTKPLSVGQYIGMFLLLCIPIANIILLFVWSFGQSANLNKKNFARATLILAAISLVLWILFAGLMGAAMSEFMGGYY